MSPKRENIGSSYSVGADASGDLIAGRTGEVLEDAHELALGGAAQRIEAVRPSCHTGMGRGNSSQTASALGLGEGIQPFLKHSRYLRSAYTTATVASSGAA